MFLRPTGTVLESSADRLQMSSVQFLIFYREITELRMNRIYPEVNQIDFIPRDPFQV